MPQRPRTLPRPRAWRWRIAWLAPLAVIELIALLGVFGEAAGFPYFQRINLVEAIAGAVGASVRDIHWRDALFIPVTLVAVVMSDLLLRRPLRRSTVMLICLARLLAGLCAPFWAIAPLAMFFAPFLLVQMVAGRTDGEFYQESMPLIVTVGLWFWYQSAALVRDVSARINLEGRCLRCSYDLAALPSDAERCPECGKPFSASTARGQCPN